MARRGKAIAPWMIWSYCAYFGACDVVDLQIKRKKNICEASGEFHAYAEKRGYLLRD